jgi:undecaprenyl-diphosphatase
MVLRLKWAKPLLPFGKEEIGRRTFPLLELWSKMRLMPIGLFTKLIPSFAVRLAAGFAVSATVLAVVGWLLLETSPAYAVDESARAAAVRLSGDSLTALFRLVTRFGSTVYLTVVGSAAVIFFLLVKWHRAALLFLIASAGQIVLHHGFKYLIGRSRPEPIVAYAIDDSYSFPSGHAIAGLVVYLTIAWLIANRLPARSARIAIITAATLVIAAIGISRVYFGVHHLTDVLGGWIAGLIWTAAVISGDEPDVSRIIAKA